MDEKYAYKLIRDLFEHKDAIFGELKRQTHSHSGLLHHQTSQGRAEAARQRAVSNTDESDRRAKYEARMKAVTERARDKSPAPGVRHRRDKSEGRFPVVASPTANAHGVGVGARNITGNAVNRQSLEVPEKGPVGNTNTNAGNHVSNNTNGTTHNTVESVPVISGSGSSGMERSVPSAFMGGGPGPHIPPPAEDTDDDVDDEKENLNGGAGLGGLKRSSLGSGRKMPQPQQQQRRGAGRDGSLSLGGKGEGMGVQLSDRPMD
jgi:hypothetical protein